jgi:1,4-alpha-glucan branching enzyme
MGWMHDILHYMQKDPIHRKYEHHHLTFGMLYQYSESFVQVFSHDEVVHGKSSMLSKMPGDSISAKANQLRALYGLMWLWPGKKTLFMGSEFGQSAEWNYAQSLDWHLLEYQDHQGIQSVVRDLNDLYINIPGLANGDVDSRCFEWIACADAESGVIAFIRWGETESDSLVVVAHFTPIYRENYRVGVPLDGYYKEILNTDADEYGGFGFGNSGGVESESVAWDSRDNSISINVPPNSLTVFRYTKR